jgi:hypothetical protein
MCNLHNLTPKEWANGWAQDAEPMVNIMPCYEVYPDQATSRMRGLPEQRKSFSDLSMQKWHFGIYLHNQYASGSHESDYFGFASSMRMSLINAS